MLIFTTAQAAESFAQSDPYVQNGIVTDWTVREWSVVVGSLLPAPFVPSYEWQTVAPGVAIPGGLDVELPLVVAPVAAVETGQSTELTGV